MKILTVTIKNYGAFYGEHTFRLTDRGLTLVLGDIVDERCVDSNGAGKSTLFDALDWCLFGVIPKGDHVDSIVNEKAGKDCCVTASLYSDHGDVIEIFRWRKSKKTALHLKVNGQVVTALDTRETQQRIEGLLGLDREIFHAAVYYGQGDVMRFADVTDSARMELLTKILGLEEIDAWSTRAKGMAKSLESNIWEIETAIAKEEGSKAILEAEDFKTAIEGFEEQKRQDLANLDLQIKGLDAVIARAHDEEAQQLQAELESLESELAKPQYKDLDAALVVNRELIRRLEIDVDRATRQGEGQCAACGQEITGDYLAERVVTFQTQLTDARGRCARLEAQVQHANEKRSRLGFLQGELALRRREAGNAHNARPGFERQMGDLMSRANPYMEQEREQKERLGACEKHLFELGSELKAMREGLQLVQFWVDAFSPKGLKSYILDSRLSEMNDTINKWVGLVTGNVWWVRLESQKLTRGGALKNQINIRVFKHRPDGTILERNYPSWSGGEKQRVSLAIDIGLSRLIAARSKHRYDILILDELFKSLDHSGRMACIDMLHELAKEKSSLFVIDHDTDIKGAFENVVTIRKQADTATIVEEPNGYPEPAAAEERRRLPTRTPV